MWKKKKEKDKYISLYIVKDTNKEYLDEANNIPYVACVTSTEEEAEEFIKRKLILDHSTHFKMWCELRKLEPNINNWDLYQKALNITNSYIYFKFSIKYNTISSILRIFYGCAPIGCSFDTVMETANALMQVPEEEMDKIAQELKEKLNTKEESK